MSSLLQMLSPEAGQRRRSWLEEKLGAGGDAMDYYLGPTGIPDKVRGLAKMLDFTDAGDMVAAGDASRELWNNPSIGNAANYAAAGGALALPFYSARMGEGLADLADEAVRSYDPNVTRIFAGKNAKTADLDAMRRAEEALNSGADRADVWRQTGWMRGPDGKMRFEIDDSQARMKNATNEKNIKKRDGLAASFQHDDLYAAYPDTRNTDFVTDYEGAGQRQGVYYSDDDQIGISPFTLRNRSDTRSTMLHEVQHAAQNNEGFARGGNVNLGAQEVSENMWRQAFKAQDELDAAVASLPPEYQRQWDMFTELGGDRRWAMMDKMEKNETLAPVLEKMWQRDRLNEMAGQGVDSDAAYDAYRKFAGETEARNVQTRRDFTPEQRRATPPWETQDVPEDEQILRGLLRGNKQ